MVCQKTENTGNVPCHNFLTDVKNHGIPHTITSQFKELTTLPDRTDVDNYDIEELYEFADATGILERHKALLSQPFNESQVRHRNHKDHIILSLTVLGGHEDHVL